MSSSTLPWLFSPDDHLVTPADVWESRLPAALVERGPRLRRTRGVVQGVVNFRETDDGYPADAWEFDGELWTDATYATRIDLPREERGSIPSHYDTMPKSCYDPAARLASMDQARIENSVCYPNMWIRFAGQTFSLRQDKELCLACIRAYNDWVIEEWTATSNGRLIPMMTVPLWDVDLAVAEVERNAVRGFRAVTFSEIPHTLGFPSVHSGYWDRFFAACEANNTVVNLHVGTGGMLLMPNDLTADTAATSSGATASTFSIYSCQAMMDLIFAGVFERYPGLRVCLAESNAGWVPYFLHRAEQVWDNTATFTEMGGMRMRPTEYFRRNIWLTFFSDPVALNMLELIGPDRLLYEVDFPHNDSEWPDSHAYLTTATAHLSREHASMIAAGNARAMYGLDATLSDA
jgi:predicted TIM-barrel fold metal-dependent hydrolase